MATSIGLAGLVPQFWMLYPLLIFAGFGNSIFHPSDFSALSHYVSVPRHGRAFSIHAFAGSLGYAAAPLVTGSIGVLFGWRTALVVAGLLGGCMTGLLLMALWPSLHAGFSCEHHAGGPAEIFLSASDRHADDCAGFRLSAFYIVGDRRDPDFLDCLLH